MYIARVLFPVKVLGPGERIVIWLSGCNHKCKGCSNPELWEQKKEQNISLFSLKKIIEPITDNYCVDGITITGGDPFFQPESLRELLPYLRSINKDILVYTGYKYEQLMNQYEDILKYVAVLIDGEYIEERNKGSILRGSDNQRIIYIDRSFKERYMEYIKQEYSQIQNFTTKDGIISVGIHLPEYEKKLKSLTEKKGLEGK